MFKTTAELDAQAAFYGRFDPLRGESMFSTPFFVRFNTNSVAFIPEDFKAGWIRSALAELERASSSSYRKFHRPLVCEAAINIEYRKSLLDEAFQSI